MPDKLNVLVFSGGLGLGAYHAGVYEAYPLPLHWCCGSSIGAITSALIAGNPPEKRVGALRAYWERSDAAPNRRGADPLRHTFAWMSALGTRLIGSHGHFHPEAGGRPAALPQLLRPGADPRAPDATDRFRSPQWWRGTPHHCGDRSGKRGRSPVRFAARSHHARSCPGQLRLPSGVRAAADRRPLVR